MQQRMHIFWLHTAQGHWRELPNQEQMQKQHEIGGVGHDGKPLIGDSRS